MECITPMEIYHRYPQYRNFLIKNNIIWVNKSNGLDNQFYPSYDCFTTDEKGKSIQKKNYPFYSMMFEFTIESLKWDFIKAMEIFKKDTSFIAPNWKTIILEWKFI